MKNLPNRIFGISPSEAYKKFLENPDEQDNEVNPIAIPTGFSSSKDCWEIKGVKYRDKIHTINLLKTLLDSGNSKTQKQWAEYSNKAKEKGDFYLGDMPLYHAVFTALFKQKDAPDIEQARQFIQKQMRERYPMTLTRIAYQPSGKDKIIHNLQMPDQYNLEESIVGADREITEADKPALKALIGTDNINEIKSVYQWINQTPAWIWRVNSKPKSVDERVARFLAGSGWANLACGGGPGYAGAGLGVFLCAEGANAQKN